MTDLSLWSSRTAQSTLQAWDVTNEVKVAMQVEPSALRNALKCALLNVVEIDLFGRDELSADQFVLDLESLTWVQVFLEIEDQVGFEIPLEEVYPDNEAVSFGYVLSILQRSFCDGRG